METRAVGVDEPSIREPGKGAARCDAVGSVGEPQNVNLAVEDVGDEPAGDVLEHEARRLLAASGPLTREEVASLATLANGRATTLALNFLRVRATVDVTASEAASFHSTSTFDSLAAEDSRSVRASLRLRESPMRVMPDRAWRALLNRV